MFFFVNYEGIRLVQGVSRIGNVPGCNLVPANCVVTAANPATAQALSNTLKIFPNATTIINGQPQVLETASRNAHENYVLARFDYNISSKDSLFVRYISDKSQFNEPFGGGGFGGTTAVPYWPELDFEHQQFATIEWRRLIASSLVNTAHVSFSRPSEIEYTGQTAAAGLVNGNDPLQFFPGSGRQDASLSITGLTALGGAFQLPFNTIPNRYTAGDDVLWTSGAHSVRLGASVQRIQTNTFMPFFQGGNWGFTSLSNFLKGVVGSVQYVPLGAYANRDYRETAFAPYVQEDWKVSPRLTLNLGLRWDFVTNAVEKHNQLYYVPDVATAVPPYAVHVSHVMATNPNVWNFGPRFGFAFDPFADHKTSIRAAFGIFHDPTAPRVYTAGYWACPPWGLNVARYNSLLLTLTRRFTRNVQVTASYNWSRCISDGAWLGSFNSNGQSEFMNPYNTNQDKGLCPYNQSQVFKTTSLAALPFHGNRLVEGWQMSGIVTANTGLPLTLTDNYDESTGLTTGSPSNPNRPDYSPNNPASVINGVSYPACNNHPILGSQGRYFNPNCFTISAPGTLGNLGSDTVIGPRIVNLDIGVLKDTAIRESLRMQFRAEFFNILNHTNYALPAAALFVGGGSTPGGSLANYTGRNQAAGQIINMVGTPRQIQFALKMIF